MRGFLNFFRNPEQATLEVFDEKILSCFGLAFPVLMWYVCFAVFAMPSDVWEDLVVSMLSVNNYSLEKTYSCVDSLRQHGIFEPKKLAGWTQGEIAGRLRRGGYDRGEYLNNLLANRLSSLGKFVQGVGVQESEQMLAKSDTSEIGKLLKPVKGIGPQVLRNFALLRQPSPK